MDPVRTCVGCGVKAGQRQLVRLRIEGERVVIDRDRRGGRGAWLHADRACLEQAVRRRALARAFRGKAAAVDAPSLLAELTGNARKD
ncbi:MAG TPA: YlxR family protein [Anaeromyxobacter sp.]|nr:YlxR family protein [Anaeromyxobacter sp.]